MTETETIKVTIEERGNGFPDEGAYVPGGDGQLFRVVSTENTIHTGAASGCANWIRATVEPVEWDACEEGDEFPAAVVLDEDAETT